MDFESLIYLMKICSKLKNTVNIVIRNKAFMGRSRISMNLCRAVMSPEKQPHKSANSLNSQVTGVPEGIALGLHKLLILHKPPNFDAANVNTQELGLVMENEVGCC